MGSIQVLPFSVANRIAAGEVVERPASAIKELIENAMDADATRITVEIQNGGMTFMRVTDDGCGMSADDLAMCIRRHATSKIRSAADLSTVLTMGFRGEALAAIASVCEMRIMSRRHDEEMGNILEASQGNMISVRETGCMVGTTVIVEELFASVPARRKFMRRDATEAQAVVSIVEKLALARPDIAFRLIVDGNTKLQTAGDGNLKATIYATLGKEFANRMIEVKGALDGVELSGFISRPDFVRGTRSAENFFINRRYVRSAPAAAALEQAYHSFMATEKFPACVLHLSMNPEAVDFNVHPAKLEVKFSRESAVFTVIYTTVRSALSADESRPELHFAISRQAATQKADKSMAGERTTTTRRTSDAFAPVYDRKVAAAAPEGNRAGKQMSLTEKEVAPSPSSSLGRAPSAPSGEPPVCVPPIAVPSDTLPSDMPPATPPSTDDISVPSESMPSPPTSRGEPLITAEQYAKAIVGGRYHAQQSAETMSSEGEKPSAEPPSVNEAKATAEPSPPIGEKPAAPHEEGRMPAMKNWRIVGQIFNSYIIVETEDKMLMIDQHAAHERLLYEQLRARMHEVQPTSQPLFLPLEVMMMSDEVVALCDYQKELESIGFSFTAKRNTLEVSALPTGIDREVASDMLCTIAERIRNNTGGARLTRDIIFERALYQGACKAAIKAGRTYAQEHLEWLVEQLMQLPDITVCPHGRPVAMQMSKQNIDHQFERS
ncbi:MAG: DNA mismatch repair endonuclease MutL [Clostridia bacterium]|nr:DNA mismatch repair endonuclease MutL [Clostridia bacterium]MBQ7339211.1 DNA mismatch repair endonuclease MutL [Clostridia bacterium]